MIAVASVQRTKRGLKSTLKSSEATWRKSRLYFTVSPVERFCRWGGRGVLSRGKSVCVPTQ